MSSYICNSKHFNSIERSLIERTYSNQFSFPYSIKDVAPEIYDYKKHLDEAIKGRICSIVDTLREINVLCVSLQYKHHYVGVLDKEIEGQRMILGDRKESAYLNDMHLYKALQSLSYQIELCHLKELRNLTEAEDNAMVFLKQMIIHLAAVLVSKTDEYQKAPWF